MPDADPAEIKAETDAADAARKLAEVRLAAAKAEQALAAAPIIALTDSANRTAGLANAQTAAVRAQLPTLTSSGIAGTTTVNVGAGGGEVSLLTAKAADQIAEKIAKAAKEAADAATGSAVEGPEGEVWTPKWIIFPGVQGPSFDLWTLLKLKASAVDAARSAANTAKDDADEASLTVEGDGRTKASAQVGEFLAATAAGAALDTASKLGSYLQTDYTVGGVGATGVDDDFLAVSVASRMTDAVLPLRWPMPASAALSALISRISQGQADAIQSRAVCNQKDLSLRVDAAAKTDEAEVLRVQADGYTSAIARFDMAIKTADDTLTWLASSDAAGVPIIGKVVQQAALDSALEGGARVLLVHLAPSGGYYTKKNLWTFFGGMPFFVMGGVVATFTVFEKGGRLLKAGQFTIDSGYQKVSEVASQFAARPA